MMTDFRRLVPAEEFDYLSLMSALKKYKKPRDKISRLLKSGAIIRVKKGLYIFGPQYSKGPACKELLANMIYGPSYVSLEYALSFHGFIPERVEMVTSMTNKMKNKKFSTPVGNFSYHYLHPSKYPVGIIWHQADSLRHIFIASKEKALADLIARQENFSDRQELDIFLSENLRIEQREIHRLNIRRAKKIAKVYNNRNVSLLYELLRSAR